MNELQHLLNKLNKVTAYHRHGNKIPPSALDDLANAQIEYEKAIQVEAKVMQKIASIKEQALKGLLTDGGHHKQWFLEAILGMLTTEKEWLYLKEKEQWEEGIAP